MLKTAVIAINLLVLLLVVTFPANSSDDFIRFNNGFAAVSIALNTYFLWRHSGENFQRWAYVAIGLLFLTHCLTVTSYDECLDAYWTRFDLLASSSHQADAHWRMLADINGYAGLGGMVLELGLVVFILIKIAFQRQRTLMLS